MTSGKRTLYHDDTKCTISPCLLAAAWRGEVRSCKQWTAIIGSHQARATTACQVPWSRGSQSRSCNIGTLHQHADSDSSVSTTGVSLCKIKSKIWNGGRFILHEVLFFWPYFLTRWRGKGLNSGRLWQWNWIGGLIFKCKYNFCGKLLMWEALPSVTIVLWAKDADSYKL